MGKVIAESLTLVIIAGIIAAVLVYHRRRKSKDAALDRGWAVKGDLNARQEKALIAEVNSAAILFRRLLAPPADLTSDMTLLRHEDREGVEAWLRRHNASASARMRRAIEES